jgi:hypothetical protein
MQGIDIVVALALASQPARTWEFAPLARALHVGAATAHRAVGRLIEARLVDPSDRRVRPLALRDFLAHGLPHVFPAQPGPQALGVPTAHSAPVMADLIAAQEGDALVWPSSRGSVRGSSVDPLHRSVVSAALENRGLYDLLALADALRLGRARERKIAHAELVRRLTRA